MCLCHNLFTGAFISPLSQENHAGLLHWQHHRYDEQKVAGDHDTQVRAGGAFWRNSWSCHLSEISRDAQLSGTCWNSFSNMKGKLFCFAPLTYYWASHMGYGLLAQSEPRARKALHMIWVVVETDWLQWPFDPSRSKYAQMSAANKDMV